MHPANVDKIEAPKNATVRPTTTLRDPEKQSLDIAEVNSQPDNMSRIQHLFFALLILAFLGLTIVSATSNQQGNGIPDAIAKERLHFQELLDSVEPNSLHEVLHKHMKDRYKHGVYQEDKHAMEVVHQENAVVAHSLLELAKRQSGNSTTTVVTSTASTVTETTTTAIQTVSPSTLSTISPPTSTSQSNSPAAPSTTSVQATSTSPVKSTSSPAVSPTDVQTSPSPKATSPAVSRSVTQQVLYTTTLSNGGVSTVTSVTVVPAAQGETSAGSSTSTARASVQTNSAKSGKILGINSVLGVLGLIMVVSAL
ncbi:hypothetical protein NA56DRAFT_337904 [Hyaloscypha hepaticicola]|uniref:Uncharacterized protein n=1 Tax=Hyaloscypha hepaticicola TaxID=2082293 RepID=A0A2J6QIR5_9HELO|nr:hypothetical protein NA56DRAFT_337904 [Hyaloscypha hepaticicola]